jgi:rubrerythrin
MDFSSFKDVIQFAIEREEEAYQGYGDMSEKTEVPGIKELLLELQAEEKKHKELLQDISGEKIDDLERKSVLDLKISDYLVEEPATPDMNFQDLLIFAAKKEQKAVELYSRLSEKASEEELKKLFEFLVDQEKSHKYKLEVKYEEHVLDGGY